MENSRISHSEEIKTHDLLHLKKCNTAWGRTARKLKDSAEFSFGRVDALKGEG